MARYLAARDGRYGGLVGQLVCPVSRLSALVAELARSVPARPVDLSLVVDTGLGGVPKALSTVFSRASLLTPRTVETAAPPDVDAMWLERVSEFVPEDVVAVVEPRRPHTEDTGGTTAWLEAVRRVAEHGCAPKLRCGGPRASDVPDSVARRGVRAGRRRDRARRSRCWGCARSCTPQGRHGILNLLRRRGARPRRARTCAARCETTDGAELAAEVAGLSGADRQGRAGAGRRAAASTPTRCPRAGRLGLLADAAAGSLGS